MSTQDKKSTEPQNEPHSTKDAETLQKDSDPKMEEAKSAQEIGAAEPSNKDSADAGDADLKSTHPAKFWEKIIPRCLFPKGPNLHHKKPQPQPPQPQPKGKLIEADLEYIKQGRHNLERYQQQLREKHEEAGSHFEKIEKTVNEEYLGELQKAVIKLKLKIPAKFRVDADDIDSTNKLQLEFKEKKDLPKKLEDIKPKVHKEKVFQSSVEFKDFEARYNKLTTEKKLCLLCFSIFPEDAIIKKRLMVQWWVCEGFAAENEQAGRYFKELMEEGFIEPVNENKSPTEVKECRMHPFYRSTLAMLAEKAMLFNFKRDSGEPTQDFRGCSQSCLVGDGVISYDVLEEEYAEAKKAEAKKAGKAGKAGKADLEDVLKTTLEKVHLIFNVKESKLEFKHDWFSMMKNVKFMHLGNWRNSVHVEVESTDFLEKVEKMNYLKFLSLQGVANIIELPPSVSKFGNLEILDLRACHNLEKIPENIGELRSLIHLDMSECSLLDHMPKGLGELEKLEVLKGFVVGKQYPGSKSCTLDDLRVLKKLEKLCIYTGLREFPTKEQVKELGQMENLEKLSITWGVIDTPEQKEVERQSRRPNPNPNRVQESSGSSNDTYFSKLTKLDLKCFPAPKSSSPPNWLSFSKLAPLGKLEKLYIRGGVFSDLGQDEVSNGRGKVVWKVKHLRLKYLSEMEMEWEQVGELFPELEFLEQVDCPNLSFFPCDANGVWRK